MKKLVNIYIMIIVLIMCVISIFVYGFAIRKLKIKDVFENEYLCTGCDGWAFLHFLFFMLVGFLDPNKYILYCIVGIMWECIETYLGQNDVKFFGKRIKLVGEAKIDKDGKTYYDDKAWWYGRVTDVAFNLSGYIIGSYINSVKYGKCKVD